MTGVALNDALDTLLTLGRSRDNGLIRRKSGWMPRELCTAAGRPRLIQLNAMLRRNVINSEGRCSVALRQVHFAGVARQLGCSVCGDWEAAGLTTHMGTGNLTRHGPIALFVTWGLSLQANGAGVRRLAGVGSIDAAAPAAAPAPATAVDVPAHHADTLAPRHSPGGAPTHNSAHAPHNKPVEHQNRTGHHVQHAFAPVPADCNSSALQGGPKPPAMTAHHALAGGPSHTGSAAPERVSKPHNITAHHALAPAHALSHSGPSEGMPRPQGAQAHHALAPASDLRPSQPSDCGA